LRSRGELYSRRAATARPIVDDELLPEACAQLRGKRACDDIGPATRSERHDDAHGTRRIRLLRESGRSDDCEQRSGYRAHRIRGPARFIAHNA
jgi:hypothetical protein